VYRRARIERRDRTPSARLNYVDKSNFNGQDGDCRQLGRVVYRTTTGSRSRPSPYGEHVRRRFIYVRHRSTSISVSFFEFVATDLPFTIIPKTRSAEKSRIYSARMVPAKALMVGSDNARPLSRTRRGRTVTETRQRRVCTEYAYVFFAARISLKVRKRQSGLIFYGSNH